MFTEDIKLLKTFLDHGVVVNVSVMSFRVSSELSKVKSNPNKSENITIKL